MEYIKKIVGVELDDEECYTLYNAELLLINLQDKLEQIPECNLEDIDDVDIVKEAFDALNKVTCRWNVHVNLGVDIDI